MRTALLLLLLGAALVPAGSSPAPAQEAPSGVLGKEGPPPPATAKSAPQPFSKALGIRVEAVTPVATATPLDEKALRMEDGARVDEDLTLRTGVGVGVTVRMKDGRWDEAPGTGWLWTAEVVSPGAKALRLHFDRMQLPAGAQVIAYAPTDPGWISGPYEGRGPLGDGTLWTQPVPGERIRVECFVPGPGRPEDDLFAVDWAIHVYRDLFGNEFESMALDTTCWVDVMCRADWIPLSHGVARLDHVFSNGTYSAFCSGTLLNSLNGDLTPYVLTASHCVSTPSGAQSTFARWFYQSPYCGQPPPGEGSVPASGGCTVLATDKSTDFTLLMVDGALPGGLYWAGWSSAPVADGTDIAGVHHPEGRYKRYAGGHKQGEPRPGFIFAHYLDGTVEHGSSGSGMFRVDTKQLVGQLCCGNPGCLAERVFWYGALASTYPVIAGYLAGGSDDALEPDDDCANARSVTTAYYPDLIVKSQSPDWYSIVVPTNVHLRIAVSFQHSWGDIDAQLYDGCGGALVAMSGGSGNSELLDYTNTGPTRTFYARVYLYSDTRNSYTMNVFTQDLPDLSATVTPPGFSSPVVPRNSNDAVYGGALVTPVLDGNVFHTWINCAVQSEGPATAPAFASRLILDGNQWLTDLSWGAAPPGSYQALNVGTAIVRGGRHTLTHTVDPDGHVGEPDRSDNAWSGQWVWSPYALADQTPVTRALPPDPGYGSTPNCDGFQLTGNWWGAVALCPTNADDDYDLALFDDYTGSTGGFAEAKATSVDAAGESDFALFNGNVLGYGRTRWAGITSFDPRYGADFVIQPSSQLGPTYAVPHAYGDSISVPGALAVNQVLQVYEIQLVSAAVTYTFRLTHDGGGADLDIGLYAASGGYAGKGDYEAISANVGAGTGESFEYRPASAGYYALLVWKRGWDDLGNADAYTLTIGPTRSNLVANVMPANWSGPIVPRNDGTAAVDDAQVSPTLDGNTLDTYVSWAIAQYGPNDVPPWSSEVRLGGGDVLASVLFTTATAPGVHHFLGSGPLIIAGGRHSLTDRADVGGAVAESDEGDNGWSGQWVWSPLPVWRASPVVRPAPPAWGAFVTPDCDGFRCAREPQCAWVVSSASFAPADDYDLSVYDDYAGSTSGFSHELKGSLAGSDATDFVVGHYVGTPLTLYPAVTKYAGEGGSYAFDATDALGRTGDNRYAPTVSFASQVLAANRLADVYEAYVLAGNTYHLALARDSGSSDLQFEVFPATEGGIWGRLEYAAISTAAGAARDTLLFTASATGYSPLVVFRPVGRDVSATTYTLAWHVESGVDVPPGPDGPLALDLGGARPDPIRGRGYLEFTLAQPGPARLVIYDLNGRVVRALADGTFDPGRHSIAWDGLKGIGIAL